MKSHKRAFLGFRYFRGHLRRFLFLILAISFGFALITVMTSLSRGMYGNVSRAARNHYGGELFVLGYHKQYGMLGMVESDAAVQRAVDALPQAPSRWLKRSLLFSDGFVYFAGNGSRQKYVYGVDFPREADLFPRSPGPEDSRAIILSAVTAGQLGARIGDDVVLKVRTKTGQINTGNFIVRDIIEDDSIFGSYKCFVDRRELNALLGLESDSYFSLGLFFDKAGTANAMAPILQKALEKELAVAPLAADKDDFAYSQSEHWTGVRHFVMTLDLYVSQVGDLLRAMDLVSYFLYIMVSLIVLVSISVTYRLIIHERSSEIGTMRAMGFQRGEIIAVLLWEALFVFLISLFTGSLLSLLILKALSLFSFGNIPGIEIFLDKGRLVPLFKAEDILLNIFLLLFILFPALLGPAYKASRLRAAAINQ
ncbi:MAG: FtsX-like permease family protein [Spirochaetales bacterium]|nr:FtsX-like permease family protein [Spirochaetales bacterium]